MVEVGVDSSTARAILLVGRGVVIGLGLPPIDEPDPIDSTISAI
jgi:hypothetical protein